MKTERERKELISAINVLLNHAYDSTLDEIHALLVKIENEEDEADLKAYEKAKADEDNELVSWEEIEQELELEIANKKDVA
jgi:ABC-type uncharacterized transport system auxiliary subunit